MVVLVVGGAGYIGSHVNKLLSKKGYKTVVFDNLVYGHREFLKWGEFVLGDLSNIEQIRLCFRKYKFDAVMHFSAYAYVGESVENPSKYYFNNVSYTLNLLQVMLENGVNNFIFSSTCATYGIPNQIPIPEDHPQNPINPYGWSKLMVEQILKDYGRAYGLKYVIFRYFNAAGADPECEIGEWHEPETHLIPLALKTALGVNDHLKIFGEDYPTPDGTCVRDFIHVDDLAEAHILGLEYLVDTGKSEVFNLGNERGFSVREVVNKVEEITKKKVKTVSWSRREGDPPVLIGSSEKARRILGWIPKYSSIETIIETSWNWEKKMFDVRKSL
ncbi:MAG: UDP-glucose 4-epimerase GalE [Brevinematia bacterium]